MNYFNTLLEYQKKYLRDKSRFKFYLKARQIGISLTQSLEIVDDCFCENDNIPWIVLSAGELQSKEFLMRCRTAINIIKPTFELHLGENLPSPEITATNITFPNGKRIIALPANPATARSYSGHVVLDEFAHHEDPDAIWAATFPTVTSPFKTNLKLRIISTPNGTGNLFYKIWHGSNEFTKHRTTIHDAKAQGFNVDIESLKKNMLSENLWKQEYECEFIDDANFELVCPRAIVDFCLNNPPSFIDGQSIAFMDFGGTIAETVLCVVRGNRVEHMMAFRDPNEWSTTSRLIAKLKELGVQPDHTFGDISGIGHPFQTMFEQQGFSFEPVNNGAPSISGRFVNRGAEIWYDAKEMIQNCKIILNNDETLITQLTSRRAEIVAGGKLGLEKKEKLAARGLASPDRADAKCGAISCAKHFIPTIKHSYSVLDMLDKESYSSTKLQGCDVGDY